MGGGAREKKQTEKGKLYYEERSSKKKTVRKPPTDWKGLISKFGKTMLGQPTERSATGMDVEVPRAPSSAPKSFEMKPATFGGPKPKDVEMDALTAQLSKSGIGGRKRKTRRRKSRR
jgi:hypothetical protein